MDNFVQYHNSEAMGVSCLELTDVERNGFRIATSKSISELNESRIWLIGGIGKPRNYYLCYYFFVDEIEPSDGDSYFKFYVNGQQGKIFEPAILLSDFHWFKDFLKSQQNFSLGLRKIDQVFVDELEKIASSNVVPNASFDEQVPKVGGGFGNPETNRKVEQAAVSFVKDYYEQNHWLVESLESEKCGYDLLCTKNSVQEHVEVKGIQGDLVSFIITNGEVKQSQADVNFVLCAVTSALSNPKLHRFSASEFRKEFALETISYRATLKQR
jgi:hypothetical protein